MKTKFYLIIIVLLMSCSFESALPGYSFSNFKNTPVEKLAEAVDNQDIKEIDFILSQHREDIDFKDPVYNMDLLTLSIANGKRIAFKKLLELGANPNNVVGSDKNTTPLLTSMEFQEDCDVYLIDMLLKYRADPNLRLDFTDTFGNKNTRIPIMEIVQNKKDFQTSCNNSLILLLNRGATLKECYSKDNNGICTTLIRECIGSNNIGSLKYLIIEKKIPVPDTAMVLGSADLKTLEILNLKQALEMKSQEYKSYPIMQKEIGELLQYLAKRKGSVSTDKP